MGKGELISKTNKFYNTCGVVAIIEICIVHSIAEYLNLVYCHMFLKIMDFWKINSRKCAAKITVVLAFLEKGKVYEICIGYYHRKIISFHSHLGREITLLFPIPGGSSILATVDFQNSFFNEISWIGLRCASLKKWWHIYFTKEKKKPSMEKIKFTNASLILYWVTQK